MLEASIAIASLLLHAAAIFIVLVMERRSPSATLAWLLALVFLPLFGFLFWLVFGRMRASRIAKEYTEAAGRLSAVLDRHNVATKLGALDVAAVDDRTESMLKLGRRLTSTPASLGNRATMLVNAEATYRSMTEAVFQAEHHVHVEFYIIQPDETGKALRDMLVKRARDGIEVRLVYDGLGSAALPATFWKPLIDQGGEVAVFRPVRHFLSRLRHRDRFDFRNHRKLVIADGRVGFTGGINIGREYLGLDPQMGYWRDTHVRIEGPAVLSLQKAFAETWLSASGKLLDKPEYYPDPQDTCCGTLGVQVVDSGPDRTYSPISYIFTQSFALARERIWITSPYFIPNPSIEEALISAALRDIDVRLLLPARPDHRIVWLAGMSYFPALLEAGVRIFQYRRGFVHAKTMVVDDWVATIGSANMDMRSFHLNWELNAFVYGSEFAQAVAQQYLHDLEGATERTLEHERQVTTSKRLVRAGARLLSPLM